MNSWDLPPLAWRKSRRSDDQGAMCVEVAGWRKSRHSNEQGGVCVEVAGWRKSRHSGNQGGTCVEVAADDRVVFVRDSKDPDGPVLAFGAAEWESFRRSIS